MSTSPPPSPLPPTSPSTPSPKRIRFAKAKGRRSFLYSDEDHDELIRIEDEIKKEYKEKIDKLEVDIKRLDNENRSLENQLLTQNAVVSQSLENQIAQLKASFEQEKKELLLKLEKEKSEWKEAQEQNFSEEHAKIKRKKDDLAEARKCLAFEEGIIEGKKISLAVENNKLEQCKKEIEQKEKAFEDREKNLEDREEAVQTREKNAEKRNKNLVDRENTIKQQEKDIGNREESVKQQEAALQTRENNAEERKKNLVDHENTIKQQQKNAQDRENTIKQKEKNIGDLEKSVKQQAAIVEKNKKDIERREALAKQWEAHLKLRQERITKLENDVDKQNKDVKALQAKVTGIISYEKKKLHSEFDQKQLQLKSCINDAEKALAIANEKIQNLKTSSKFTTLHEEDSAETYIQSLEIRKEKLEAACEVLDAKAEKYLKNRVTAANKKFFCMDEYCSMAATRNQALIDHEIKIHRRAAPTGQPGQKKDFKLMCLVCYKDPSSPHFSINFSKQEDFLNAMKEHGIVMKPAGTVCLICGRTSKDFTKHYEKIHCRH